jgi:NADH:ubiquinone reductase (H+-translocating)
MEAGMAEQPRVVIVGGGFAGLECARMLGGSSIPVTIIDKQNHNLFQPLLYQVATAALSPADIAEPIRKIVRRHKNISTLMAEVVGIDLEARQVKLADGDTEPYDVLVLATGSRYSYFGHDDWATVATGLKTITNATTLRRRLLQAFEKAEQSEDPEEQKRLLTAIVVGGGPTGVEMAGAIAELGRWTLKGDFRRIDPASLRVLLVEGSERVLGNFPESLSRYAAKELTKLGVTILTKRRVKELREDGAQVDDEFIGAGTLVWAAGVQATPAAGWLGIETDRSGRIPINADMSVKGLTGVFALGDITLLEQDGQPLPGLAQVAKQQGHYLGKTLRDGSALNGTAAGFRFHNRGNTAVIGRNAAVFDFGRYQLKGRFAWFLWALIHVYLLVSFEKRMLVSMQWLWRYFTRSRGARLIQ